MALDIDVATEDRKGEGKPSFALKQQRKTTTIAMIVVDSELWLSDSNWRKHSRCWKGCWARPILQHST